MQAIMNMPAGLKGVYLNRAAKRLHKDLGKDSPGFGRVRAVVIADYIELCEAKHKASRQQ